MKRGGKSFQCSKNSDRSVEIRHNIEIEVNQLRLPPIFRGIRVAQTKVFCVVLLLCFLFCFVLLCFALFLICFGHCNVFPLIYDGWLSSCVILKLFI